MSQLTETNLLSPIELPLLPLRDVVVYPQMVIPLFVGREKSIHALEAAMAQSKKVFLLAQRDAEKDDPELDELYSIGTQANILQLLRLPDGTVKVLIEGAQRAKITRVFDQERINEEGEEVSYVMAEVQPLASETLTEREQEVLTRVLLGQFEHYVKLSKKEIGRAHV